LRESGRSAHKCDQRQRHENALDPALAGVEVGLVHWLY
jgi:hypothetical protein